MPELPEVQTVVNDLNRKVLGRRLISVWSDWPRSIKGVSPTKFKKEVRNLKIERITRRAKNIVFLLRGRTKEFMLLIHPKMTGHILMGGPAGIKNKHIHFIFFLSGKVTMNLSDVRKFAKVVFGPRDKIEKSEHLARLGPEPLDPSFKSTDFEVLLKGQKRKIKQVLMDPKAISGIGNIYSDEVLWLSRINPLKPANSINGQEASVLYKAIKKILREAIRLRGSSTSNFRDTSGRLGRYGVKHQVYRRLGEPCPRCGKDIKRVRIGGRSAHYCANCQR